ncbi:helix-turn-helix domain-containing protein [Streptomyces albus]|uniref:helix-turn-helix domain-containing protein n=1 Tax=Streptomyces albus TaxID=1888 RepID=UPI0033D30D1E
MIPNGAAIRSFREARGLSLRRLAHLIGIHPSCLSRIETGQRGATDRTLRTAAEVLQVPLNAIHKETTP